VPESSSARESNRELPSDARLRLLFVGNVDSVHLQRWAGYFAERGHDVHIAALRHEVPSDSNGPFAVHRLGPPRIAFLELHRLAQRLGSQIVHAHYLTHYGWVTRAALFNPYAVTLWGSDVLLDVPASRLRRLWARVVLRGAACVTADSAEIVNIAIALGAPASRTHEIQFGVDTDRFSPGPRPTTLLTELGLLDRRIIFSPRSITPLYRTLLVVEALRDMPEDVVLVSSLAGADPAYVDLVTKAAASWGIGERIRLLPPIAHSDIDSYYRAADTVVSVPASDGTPVAVLEALAIGKPVVATDLPSVRPWLEPLGTRLMIPVDDAAATGAALREALEMTAQERTRFAAESRAIVVDRADYRRNMERMETIYRQLASP
jgi:glycosyltransferase involved in cell wall biosynthesis